MEVCRLVTIEKEKDIEFLVGNAIERLTIVMENAQKENKQIVSDLAKDLEGIIPMDTICTEIIIRLDGYLSPRTIRKYLDEKYKIKSRVDNARKQKKNNQSSLAASGPLNKVSDTLVIDDSKEISFPDEVYKQSIQPREISVIQDREAIQSISRNESLNSTEQKQSSLGQVNTGLTKCLGCIEKEERIKELEEAFQKVQQFTAADKMGPSVATETEGLNEKIEEPLEFEVSMKELEIRKYINKIPYPGAIWFSGRIDRRSGKIINFDLGRLDQSHQKSVPNRGLD
jgi:hypothetical protein